MNMVNELTWTTRFQEQYQCSSSWLVMVFLFDLLKILVFHEYLVHHFFFHIFVLWTNDLSLFMILQFSCHTLDSVVIVEVYLCALQITGELMNIRNALSLVFWKLRNHIFSNETDYNNSHISSSEIAESNATSQANIYSTIQYSVDNGHKVDHRSPLSYGVDSVEKSFSDLELSSSEIQVIS